MLLRKAIFIFKDDDSNKDKLIPTKFKENIEKHPGYKLWIDTLMKSYDSNRPQYKNFNDKIEIPIIWINSFKQFCKDLKITIGTI